MDRHYVQEVNMTACDDSSYISSLAIVEYLNREKKLSFGQDVTFLVGENGTGKSTLIEAIAVCAGYNAEGGSKNFNFATKQTVSKFISVHNCCKKITRKGRLFFAC